MKENKAINIIYWILGISAALVLTLYYVNFHSSNLSSSPTDWGVFGDYLGGVLNPIVAAMNIIVFIYLTKVISKTEENANHRNLEYQKSLLIAEMRQIAYNNIANEFSLIEKTFLGNYKNISFKLTSHAISLKGNIESISHLFPFLENYSNQLALSTSITEIGEFLKNKLENSNNNDLNMQIFKDLAKSFYKEKKTLMKLMQDEILK